MKDPYPIVGSSAVGVDQASGDVYVANEQAYRVEKFDSSGHFLFMFGKDVNKTAVEEARPEAERDLCPAPGHPGDVCQVGTPTGSAGGFDGGGPLLVAVDNSSGPSAGDVYVGETGWAKNDSSGLIIQNATGGTFKLSFEGQETAPISYNASAAEVQEALEALSTIGAGNVCVSGNGNNPEVRIYGIEFCHGLATTSLPSLAVDATSLSSGSKWNFSHSPGSAGAYSNVSKFNSAGHLVSSWGNNGEGEKNGSANGQLNGLNATGSIQGPFAHGYPLLGLAVDSSGHLWVQNGFDIRDGRDNLFKFAEDGSFLTAWSPEDPSIKQFGGGGITVDGAENVYISGSNGVGKFTATGVYIGIVAPSKAEVEAQSQKRNNNIGEGPVTFDPARNELYVAAWGPGASGGINVYDSFCEPTMVEIDPQPGCVPAETFGPGSGGSLAADSSADLVYSDVGSHVVIFAPRIVPDVVSVKASGFTAGGAVLNGTVNPDGVALTECFFEWGESTSYGHVAPCQPDAGEVGTGSLPVSVHAQIAVQSGHVYHFRLVAGNADQVNELIDEPSLGSDLTFGPAAIESESVIAVGADSATVQAQVDPHDVDTRIRVEYGSQPGVYDHSTLELDLGAGDGSQLASVQLTGLEAASTYHYRVVAESALGEGPEAVIGADRAFMTQSRIVGAVPVDSRVWELVSPPNKRGAEPYGIGESGPVVQAAATGDAVTYPVTAPTEAEPPGYPDGVQELSRRTSEGWQSGNVGIPHDKGTGASVGAGAEYRFFSTDLSLGIVQPFGAFDPRVSPEASEQTAYLGTNFLAGNVGSPCLKECFRPLVTGAEGHENVPPETIFAQTCEAKHGGQCAPFFEGASPDSSHVVLSSSVPLVEGAPAGKESGFEQSLYEWSSGKLSLVSVLPNEQPYRGATFGGSHNATRGAISSDGSRVVWSTGNESLYVRDTVKEKTVQVGGGHVQFQFASSDGSKIVYDDEGGLQECMIVEENEVLRCETSVLAPSDIGAIPGASEDASYVYFVANGVLQNNGVPVAGAQPGNCVDNGGLHTAGVTCNLYVRHDGVIKLVAELSGEDGTDWSRTLSELTARVSPDGHWLAFMSTRSVTGYDNRDAVSGVPDPEVYLYDADGNNGEGKVVCASCNSTGARPHGLYEPQSRGYPWKDGTIPGWTPWRLGQALYQSRYLSDSGRLFFESNDALVPQDSNGARDVYEYEPSGVGDCTTVNAGYVEGSGGCVGLISSGTSRTQSKFLDASENGNDVFFVTTSQLARADSDEVGDVYDARVDGGFPEPSHGPVCEGDACQSPFSAPEDATPGSLTYSGPGNPGAPAGKIVVKGKHGSVTRAKRLAKMLAACKRDRSKRVREQCVLRAHKRYGPIKAGKSGGNRGRR